MVGLLVFEDRDFTAQRGHKRCSSHPPRAIIDMNQDGTDPMSPAFPASGQVCFIDEEQETQRCAKSRTCTPHLSEM